MLEFDAESDRFREGDDLSSEKPSLVEWARTCVSGSFGALLLGGILTRAARRMMPEALGGGTPIWMWAILILIWSFGAIGILLTGYCVAKYPGLSRQYEPEERARFTPSRSIVMKFGGASLWMITMLLAIGFVALAADPEVDFHLLGALIGIYILLTTAFGAWFLLFYHHDKHVTVATFLMIAEALGFLFFPICFPFVVVGSIQLRRK